MLMRKIKSLNSKVNVLQIYVTARFPQMLSLLRLATSEKRPFTDDLRQRMMEGWGWVWVWVAVGEGGGGSDARARTLSRLT